MSTYQQIAADIYQRCNHFDPYLPPLSADLARAWGKLFEKHRLSHEDLLAGVEVVYDEHGGDYRPKPADIITAARAIRQDRYQRQPLDERIEAGNDAMDARLMSVVAELTEAKSIPDDDPPPRYQRPTPAQRSPRSVPCPHCHVGAGTPCFNVATKKPLRQPPHYHPKRIDAAKADETSRRREVSVAVADRQCACGRPIFDDADACNRCQPVINGPQPPQQTNGDRGTA